MVRVCRVVPKDWTKFDPLGNVIPRTRFIVFKTPINSGLSTKLHKEQRFTTNNLFRMLAERGQHLGLVVDLTDTDKYYDKEDITGMCVQYEKINCPGRGFIESKDCVDSFNQVIKDYTDQCKDEDALIGVHCTNGVNRSGYLICRFLIKKLGWSSHEAIDAFEQARGYSIEKGAYVMALHKAAKESRNKRADSDSDSSERRSKKKNKRKHRDEEIHMVNAILNELGQQSASVSGAAYSSPNGIGTPEPIQQQHSQQQQTHWGFAIKRSKYSQLNQPETNGATPPEMAAGNTPLEEEEFDEDLEDIEDEGIDVEAGKGQSVSSKRRARRNRMQKCLQVMARGRFHEIQAMREEVTMTHGNARD